MLHAPAVQFKGAGWYVTDYAGKGKSGGKDEGATDSSAAKADGTAPSGEKAESKESGKKAPEKKK